MRADSQLAKCAAASLQVQAARMLDEPISTKPSPSSLTYEGPRLFIAGDDELPGCICKMLRLPMRSALQQFYLADRIPCMFRALWLNLSFSGSG